MNRSNDARFQQRPPASTNGTTHGRGRGPPPTFLPPSLPPRGGGGRGPFMPQRGRSFPGRPTPGMSSHQARQMMPTEVGGGRMPPASNIRGGPPFRPPHVMSRAPMGAIHGRLGSVPPPPPP